MPDKIVERASAKVNLALHVLGRRLDGYHELDSIVAFSEIADVLEMEAATQTSLTITGHFASALPVDDSNIVIKAV
jgi:4-diphosphocytidyl-2-C-methyl-D-erythritol kinase